MRGQRGQGGRKKTVPGVLTDAQAEEFSRYAVPLPAMTPVVDNMLHDDAMRMCKAPGEKCQKNCAANRESLGATAISRCKIVAIRREVPAGCFI